MSEGKRLSHSACAKYMQCPASYDYHYNKRIRPIQIGSALAFGQAMDAGLNALLLGSGDPMQAYLDAMAEFPLGKVVPHKYDFDDELLDSDTRRFLFAALVELGYSNGDINRIREGQTDEALAKGVDLVTRASLEAKAKLMFEAYRREVLPNIEKVYNVQKPVGPGYLDATVEWRGIGKIILDHKTASREYSADSVEYSAQLAGYAAEEDVSKVAFVVFLKQIRKNRHKICASCGHDGTGRRHKTCPECGGEWDETISPQALIQVIHGEVTDRMKEVSLELEREVHRAVNAEIFPCNVNQCNNQYGKPCVYRDLKWKGDMTGLEVVPERGKK